MASAPKGALKAAKAAIDARNFVEAERLARSVLETDSRHYNATVFLGLALEKQGKDDEAQRVYSYAVEAKPNDALAWQGLITIYEKRATKNINEYHTAAQRLTEIFMHADDKHRCQSVVDKYVEFAKQHGTREQHRNALEMILPEGNLYDYLEGRLPHPSRAYSVVIEAIEAEENQRINRLIGERRTRIGARLGNITVEVKLEVYKNSSLEYLYQQAIDWADQDDMRRMYEERLLQRAYDTLSVLPVPEKPPKRVQVEKLSDGMVILKHPFALAWKIVLEWNDVESIIEMDASLFRQYIELFPEDGLTKVLDGFLESDASPFPALPKQSQVQDDDAEDNETAGVPLSAEDRLVIMSEGLEQSSRSMLSQRIMGEYFLRLEEYSSAVACAKQALELLATEKEISGEELQNNVDAMNIILGTALVEHESPRNHPQAREIFEHILERKPTNTSALIGVGLILEEEDEYEGAIDFLSRALARSPDIKIRSEAAWCKALMGDYQSSLNELRECLAKLLSSEKDKDLKAQVHYRIGSCLWNIDSSKAARRDRNGAYAHFLASLKANFNYAPAYTSLGRYYYEYGKDKTRARKCFQKAFEISPSEVEAAEQLARIFANQKEWDLVEAVSQRVVESGKVRPPPGSKKKGVSWPFAALGVCQLNEQDYVSSVVSFQSALRISPEDYHSWVGLGESYHHSGRYISATRAFEQAQKLQDGASGNDRAWFSEYMLANVKRELGYFDEAISSYENVLNTRPRELGVELALLQTHMEHAWSCIELGLFGRASDNCLKAIEVVGNLVEAKPSTFNTWKALGDVCAMFSWIESYSGKFPAESVATILNVDVKSTTYGSVTDIDDVGEKALKSLSSTATSNDSSQLALHAALLAQKRAIFSASNDIHAQSVAWYNLGWTEYRASVCIIDSSSQFLKAAVRCFKRAIELEAGNAEFWNALGIVTTKLNPRVAQHAFVRSLYLNDRSAMVWTNLGTLYVLQNDVELANEAFTRGQSSDPEYAHAWLGQGILALMLGEVKEAQMLFTHAFEISGASSLIGKRLYSLSSFDQMLTTSQVNQITDLLQPLFALHQLKTQNTQDLVFQHLSSLIAERIGDHDKPVEVLEKVCASLEAEYEETESTTSLAHFAQAKADLSRVQLAAGDLDFAIENAETALDLSMEEDFGKPDPSTRRAYRLSAHITSGLAHNSKGDLDSAIAMFRAALEESNGNPDIVCILAQVLWAKGGEQEQDVVREQLFDCIEKHPEHAGAISLLAVIAILDDSMETLEAVESDLKNLHVRDDLGEQQKLETNRLLTAVTKYNNSALNTNSDAEIGEAASSIMLSPAAPHGWSQMASLADNEDTVPAELALIAALGAIPPKGLLEAEDLAMTYTGIGQAADGQRAIMLAPWMGLGWGTLA